MRNPAMSVEAWVRFTGYKSANGKRGGQELILPEILAALDGFSRVWLPFLSSGTLAHELAGRAFHLPHTEARSASALWSADSLYFGTPTIVEGAPLFPEDAPAEGAPWTAASERACVRALVGLAVERRVRRIVCGLGSGDVTLQQRLEDVGAGARVVTFKDFGEFQDWVIVRDLHGVGR